MLLQVESALSLVRECKDSQAQIKPTIPQPKTFGTCSNPDLILRSSDLEDFCVHKVVLGLVSAFFKGLLSQPQSPGSETVNGLPVIRLSEDLALLNFLLSMLYRPEEVPSPSSYKQVLYFLTTYWQ